MCSVDRASLGMLQVPGFGPINYKLSMPVVQHLGKCQEDQKFRVILGYTASNVE